MRPGTELAIGAAVVVVLGVAAAALGGRRARVGDSDQRRSTYLVGPVRRQWLCGGPRSPRRTSGALPPADRLVRYGRFPCQGP